MKNLKIGLDVGSTTIKTIVLDDSGKIVYSAYERHYSQITAKTAEALIKVRKEFPEDTRFSLVISGSAGMGMAESCGVDFVQEVYATKVAAEEKAPDTDVIIELGGDCFCFVLFFFKTGFLCIALAVLGTGLHLRCNTRSCVPNKAYDVNSHPASISDENRCNTILPRRTCRAR